MNPGNPASERHCRPCEGGTPPLGAAAIERELAQLAAGWQLLAGGKVIMREFRFRDFRRTMSFVNAVAHVANIENHHPDIEAGYDYCRLRYTTHAIGGLSENDFICAALVDAIPTG
ncbi:MAG: 4a-hydroxytetrahydrobiopterin dehydratase [Gammaproteobacteria bacterium]|nr:4a-hydroxytetrahydrobiopterin dehydratase [Gammaproteobacteria bacterium]